MTSNDFIFKRLGYQSVIKYNLNIVLHLHNIELLEKMQTESWQWFI